MSKVTLSSSSKNEDIEAVFASNKAFQSGKVVLATIENTSNPTINKLMFVQKKMNSEAGTIQAIALGWTSSTERSWVNFKDEILSEIDNIEIGMDATELFKQLPGCPEGFTANIVVEHSLTPKTWESNGEVKTQNPILNRNNELMLYNGQKVYRNTSINDISVRNTVFQLQKESVSQEEKVLA